MVWNVIRCFFVWFSVIKVVRYKLWTPFTVESLTSTREEVRAFALKAYTIMVPKAGNQPPTALRRNESGSG